MWPFLLSILPFAIIVAVFLSAAIITPTAQELTNLTTILATAPWTAMKMHLSTNNFIPNPANVLMDYSSGEATFVGYAAQTITFGTPYNDSSGNAVATALVKFNCTASTTPNSCFTCYATNTAGTTLQFGSALDNSPVNFNFPGDGLTLLITVNLADGTISVVG